MYTTLAQSFPRQVTTSTNDTIEMQSCPVYTMYSDITSSVFRRSDFTDICHSARPPVAIIGFLPKLLSNKSSFLKQYINMQGEHNRTTIFTLHVYED
jgi:hypothetical protein